MPTFKKVAVAPLIGIALVSIIVGYSFLVSEGKTEIVEVTETAPLAMNDPNIKETGEVWLNLIKNAAKTIDIEAYYLGPADPPWILNDIYGALIDAAKNRGVKVRILIDSTQINQMALELKKHENIEVLFWRDGILHSKYMIVDEEVVSVGSSNLSYYAMARRGKGGNREINLTLRDERIAETYTYIFETGWVKAGGKPRGAEPVWDEDWLIPVADGPDLITSTVDAFKKLFDMAERKIYIYMYAYAGAPQEVMNAMANALERGVKIEFLVDVFSESEWPEALKELAQFQGVNVSVIDHPYAAHPKLIIVDDEWAYVGSSNIHPTWMLEGREAGVLINSEEIIADLLDIFKRDWGSIYSRSFDF
jgi:phosphatidylserine/phosphatidylglycerophosphate/cardiolipin synthase-like enzyme